MTVGVGVERELAALLGSDAVLPGSSFAYLADETEGRGVRGRAEAVVLPATTADVARVVAWCYAHDVPLVPRGGGTGYAAGAVPDGGVVLSLERMTRIRAFEPLAWKIEVEAGVRTAELRRIARESGLVFPPDPGAAEQSQLGGNIATNAGGPHAFKYGVTGAWVSGLEAVVAPGEVVTVGGPVRKNVAGFDLKSLLIGSEGTLGVITAAWLKLLPAPEAFLPVVAVYGSVAAGCDALARVVGTGLPVAALEYLDERALAVTGASVPGGMPGDARFAVISEADGSVDEALRLRDAVVEVLAKEALVVRAPGDASEAAALWRWRDGVSLTVAAQRGGKVSEDIVVPFEHLGEAIEETLAIGARHGLDACSWGHAGDGNLHSTFMVSPDDEDELARAENAAVELFELAIRLDGAISGEHGIGSIKREFFLRSLSPRALELHRAVKTAFDPKGLLNPGKVV